MVFSNSVMGVIRKAARRYPEDVDKAIDQAKRHLRQLPEWEELVDDLVTHAIREFVYDSRHRDNMEIRQQRGDYGGAAKVKAGASQTANLLCMEIYSYHVAGTILGEMVGGTLLAIADSEENKANGHQFNANLLRALDPIVPVGQKVRDAVKLTKLKSLFSRLMKDTCELAAAGV